MAAVVCDKYSPVFYPQLRYKPCFPYLFLHIGNCKSRYLHRQHTSAQGMYKFALVHNPYDPPGLAGDDLFTEQGAASALDGIEIRVNGVHPVDSQVYGPGILQGDKGDAQTAGQAFRLKRSGCPMDIQSAADSFGQFFHEIIYS